MIERETWHGCYNDGWGDLLVPEAFSHPAKAARGLIYRIVRTGLERGWWDRSTLILDPFGGVGTTGIACAANGISALSVELEQRFVELARQNYALHEAEWRGLGLPLPRIVQGDSRKLAEIVQAIGGVLTSPPYAEIRMDGGALGKEGVGGMKPYSDDPVDAWRTTRDQANLGNLPMGAISSPPYANRVDDSGTGPVAEKNGKYGESDGQIGNLRLSGITSPPFTEAQSGGGINVKGYKDGDMVGQRTYSADTAALSAENIASLPIGGVTSPPYEGDVVRERSTHLEAARMIAKGLDPTHGMTRGSLAHESYGASEGQVGAEHGETYWSAISLILSQLHELFPPGGHLAWIVKSFVRDKQIVDLPAMTLDLMLRQGWEPVVWIDASLVAEGEQGSMMPEMVDNYRKKRVSFFRRLAEKRGSPRIDEEVVLVCRKPVQNAEQPRN